MSLEQMGAGSSWASIAETLEVALSLSSPPVAITFTAERPVGVDALDTPMPPPLPDGRTGRAAAGCVFWTQGIERTFSTIAEDHGNCSVGSLTHGFVTVDDIVGKDDVATLLTSGWVDSAAVPQIPVITERPGAVTYGPLRDTSIDPDIIFIRVGAESMMLLTDALPGLKLGSKPQCHIVAVAKEQGEFALSAGCTLSRTRAGIPDSEVTSAIPASKISTVLEKVLSTKAINDQVCGYALEDAKRFVA